MCFLPDCIVKMMKVLMSTHVASLTPIPKFISGNAVVIFIVELASDIVVIIVVAMMLEKNLKILK